MKGVPGLAGHGPSGRGGPRSTRLRPQPPMLLALPVGGTGLRRAKERAGRRAEWRQARRSGAVRAQVWLMSIGLVRRARLYPPIQLYSVIARQGPPAHLTNRGGFRELGFLPGLLGIAHGIAHEVAHGIAETHGTTDSERRRGSRHPRSAPCGLGVGTRFDGSPSKGKTGEPARHARVHARREKSNESRRLARHLRKEESSELRRLARHRGE